MPVCWITRRIIGQDEGVTVRTNRGAALLALRPTLSEFVLEMPRGAQVIYPKDLGPILMLADIFPGARMLESGVGSGAMTMTLLRAIGPTGHVTGYELREDFAERARQNIDAFLGAGLPLTIETRDVYEGIDVDDLDRVVLDLPEPWQVVNHAERALRPGGILLSYLPTILQVSTLRETLAASTFGMADTIEVLHRGWNVDGQSVRPDHRMVAHTGFLTVARKLRARMNLLDLLVIVVMAIGGLVGIRVGFLVRALSWLGLAVGSRDRAPHHPATCARSLAGSSPGIRLLAVSSLLIGLALLGHTSGLLASHVLRRAALAHLRAVTARPGHGRSARRLRGARLLWLLVPALRSTPGMTGTPARGSALVAWSTSRAAPAACARASSAGSSAKRRTRSSTTSVSVGAAPND